MWRLFIFFGISLASVLMIVCTFVFYDILDEVNSRSSSDQQISPWFVNTKVFTVLSFHRNFFPDSGKRVKMWSFAIAAFCFFLLTISLGVVHYSGSGR
jgi:hypothetical protein